MKDSYSIVAPFYSNLVKLVFGSNLKKLKTVFLEDSSQKKILIIGGGDGLDYVDFQSDLIGEYWELSDAMLRKAKKNLSESKLEFHLGHFKANLKNQFDEVWLHFVLDTMSDDKIISLLIEIRKGITPAGRIYLVDFFKTQNLFQRFLTQIIITFFRLVAKHKRATIPEYERILTGECWVLCAEKGVKGGWMKAQLWQSLAKAEQ